MAKYNDTCPTSLYCSAGVLDVLSKACASPLMKYGDFYSCCFNTDQERLNVLQTYNQINGGSTGIQCGKTGNGINSAVSVIPSLSFKLFYSFILLHFLTFLIGGANAKELTDVGDCLNRYENPTNQCSIGVYTDANCQNLHNVIGFELNKDTAKGCGECRKWNEDPNALKGNLYMKAQPDFGNSNKLVMEIDNSCPLQGLNAPIATISKSSQCIQVDGVTGDEGIVCFPNGYDGGFRKLAANTTITHPQSSLTKRDANCKKLIATSQENSHSPIKKISGIVNCQGQTANCPITEAEQHTESVTSSFSLSAGGSVSGVDIGLSFGVDYTESESTTITSGYSVSPNQCGYLAAYYDSTLFKGTWTECDGPDQEGEANVIIKDRAGWKVVFTTC